MVFVRRGEVKTGLLLLKTKIEKHDNESFVITRPCITQYIFVHVAECVYNFVIIYSYV